MIDIYKQPRNELGLCFFSFPRYSKKCFIQFYRAHVGAAAT